MKILCVQPGASYATADVFDGIVPELKRQGHEIINFQLDVRLAVAGSWLTLAWRRAQQRGVDINKPTPGDVLYKAGIDVLERALRFDVEWVLVYTGMYFHVDLLIQLKRAGRKVGVILTESPYDQEREGKFIEHADIAWTNERTSVDFLRQYNPNTYYLPLAYAHDRHNPSVRADAGTPEHDVVFVGTGFQERIDTLAGVDWSGIDVGLYGEWSILGSRHRLRKHIKSGPVHNDVTTNLYRKAKIGLNLYRTSKGFGRHPEHVTNAESLNPRALELAACGVFTISDYRPEVEEVFGDLVPTFRTPGELEELIRHYLKYDHERERIASQLPAAVAGHTYAARAQQILSDLARVGTGSRLALVS